MDDYNNNHNLPNILESVDMTPKRTNEQKNIQIANFRMQKKLSQGIKVTLYHQH